ncbi:hypothetical protein L6R52_14315 [Myxococcota bacterium]|nr:hypothetical protein [Myxococcota bacterium]
MSALGRHTALALLLAALAAPDVAEAALPARDTARIGELGAGAIGIFNPLRLLLGDFELETHPIFFVVAPNATLRHEPWRGALEPLAIAIELGATLPWGLGRPPPLGLAGYFTPSCLVGDAEPERGDTCEDPGLFLVPHAGVVVSHGTEHVFTARADVALGLRLAGERPAPLDVWPYLDLLLAPIFQGHRVHAGLRYDRRVLDGLRVASELSLYHVGRGPEPHRSPWVLRLWAGADLGLTSSLRLTAGVAYYDSDQRRRVIEEDAEGFSHFVDVRSHDFAPTLDLIWALGAPE